MLILNEIFIIYIVYFHFSWSKLVKQCYIELLWRMISLYETDILCKNIASACFGQFVVNEMLSFICFHVIPVCDTLKEK